MKRLMAEWEKQEAVMFAFPHQDTDWRCCYDEAVKAFVTMIEAVAQYDKVLLVCHDANEVRRHFNSPNIEYHELPTNDTWIRDFGAIRVEVDGVRKLYDYRFNGWGGKFDASLDNAINAKLFDKLISSDFILEGGSIESNGEGVLLTTSQCLLNPNRNHTMNKAQVEAKLKNDFGVHTVLWINHGHLENDDTDAHIDTIARFVDKETVMYVKCDDTIDSHYEEFAKMEKELQAMSEIKNLIALPWVKPMTWDNHRLPATYANFLITNSTVIVPTYNDVENDTKTVGLISKFFHDKKVIGVDASIFVRQHGSVHCLSKEI